MCCDTAFEEGWVTQHAMDAQHQSLVRGRDGASGEGWLVLQCWTCLAVRKLIEFITFFKGEGKNRNHECNPTQHHK